MLKKSVLFYGYMLLVSWTKMTEYHVCTQIIKFPLKGWGQKLIGNDASKKYKY